jgi:hypothetical protein
MCKQLVLDYSTQQDKYSTSFESSETNYPVTQRHILQQQYIQLHPAKISTSSLAQVLTYRMPIIIVVLFSLAFNLGQHWLY